MAEVSTFLGRLTEETMKGKEVARLLTLLQEAGIDVDDRKVDADHLGRNLDGDFD